MCPLLLKIAQTMREPPICTFKVVIILGFLWLNAIGLICCFCKSDSGDLLSQNHLGRFGWMSLFQLFLLTTLGLERSVIFCLGVSGIPIYYYPATMLYFIMLFIRKTSFLLSLHWVFCSYYLLYKANLGPRVMIISYTCLFVIVIMLFSPLLTT